MCDERERMLEYLYDECDPAARREADQHLETCETCREELRGLRVVRNELAAWDVPVRKSVWVPFSPPTVQPWWRQVPSWAMAAAAALIFATGLVGGLVVRSTLVPVTVAAAAPAAPDLSSLEQRVLGKVRAEFAAKPPVAAVTTAAFAVPQTTTLSDAEIMKRVVQLLDARDQRQRHDTASLITQVVGDVDSRNKSDMDELRRLVSNVEDRQSATMSKMMERWQSASKDSKDKEQ